MSGRRAIPWRLLIGRLHLCIGLMLCVPLVALGLSGSLLVFDDALRGLIDPAHDLGRAAGEMKPIAEILAAAQAAAPPGFVPALYAAPTDAAVGRAAVRLLPRSRVRPGPEGSVRVDVDPVSLRVFADLPSNGLLRIVHAVHANLMLPNRQLVGWLGIAMLALGCSGLVNWWPQPRSWRAAFVVRPKTRSPAIPRQFHGAVGIWLLPVFLAVSFSGVYLAFPQTIRAGITLVLPARDLRTATSTLKVEPVAGATPLSVDEAAALAEASLPGTRIEFAALPLRPDQPLRLSLLRDGQVHGAPAIMVFVDPWTRRIVQTLDPRDYTTGETILAWLHAIHSGEGTGLVWKIPVFLTGFLPLLFVATGLSIWQGKRRSRKAADARRDGPADQLASARRAAE